MDGSSQVISETTLKLGYETLFLTYTAINKDDILIITVNPSTMAIFAYMIIGIGFAAPIVIFMFRKFKIPTIDKNKKNSENSG